MRERPRPDGWQALVWEAFVMLRGRCGAGFSGPSPISMGELRSFVALSGLDADPDLREDVVDVLMALDSRFLKMRAEG